jgi:hypothetical protein
MEVLGGSRESHDVHRFIHHSSSIKLTRALPPIQHSRPTNNIAFLRPASPIPLRVSSEELVYTREFPATMTFTPNNNWIKYYNTQACLASAHYNSIHPMPSNSQPELSQASLSE